ncbi:hypothetical protein LIER_18391 [Lithospermum erythrorhizon]|uniref:Uncharacterized protein n=1 Tax=Lithospermum erythrorhizon TaxID=34254 RepID=A0AAV3QF37_LITER
MWIEEAEKKDEKGQGKRSAEDNRHRSPEPKRRSTLDRILAPYRAYSRVDLPKGSAFSRLQGDPRKRKEIKIEKLIQMGLLKDYVHKETQSVNRNFDRDKSRSSDGSPNITVRVNVISGGRSGGGHSGSTRRAYAKRDIYMVTAGARPEFPDHSFSRKEFEGIECPHEDQLVITLVIANFEVGPMLRKGSRAKKGKPCPTSFGTALAGD